MKSLKELVAYQDLSGKQDIEIIFDWFAENDMEIEGISLMEKLAKNKVIFVVKSRPQDKNPSKPYWFATNLRLKDD